eukprot:gene7520-8318_t
MFTYRPGHQDDLRNLTVMLNASGGIQFYKAIFGSFHFATLLDCNYLTLIAEANANETNGPAALNPIKGFLCLNDDIPSLNIESSFEVALTVIAIHLPVHVHNTLFINFWMMDEKISPGRDLLLQAFTLLPHLEYIFWVLPINYNAEDFVERGFTMLDFNKQSQYSEECHPKVVFGQTNRVLFIHRSSLLPRLQVRRARIEDNDDLIPIIEQANPMMLEGQSSYFLAELIDSQDEKNEIFVGLDKMSMRVQGLLGISLEVNMSLIMRIFNIDAYPDLVIKADYLPPPPPLVIGLMGELRLLNIHAVEIAISHQNCLFLNAEKLPILSKGGSSNNSILPFVQKAIQEQGNPNLQAVIFWGLPRSEQEAHEYKDILLNEFDVLIELANQSEEAEEEEDELLQQHLDAIEVLRESFFSTDNNNANNNHSTNNNVENGTGGSDGKSISSLNCKAQWKKVIYEKDNYQSNRPEDLQKLITTLHQSLEDRRVRADAIAAINNEKPPRANGFAVTALCLNEEYHSRSIDLVKYAFEQKPSLDFCLYMLPCQELPTMITNAFNYVETRPGVSFDQSLYIIHRAYFYACEHLRVERLLTKQLNDLYTFLQPIRQQRDRQEIIDTTQRCVQENDVELIENPAEVAFAIMLNRKIVGLVTLSRKLLSSDDLIWYRAYYHLDEVVNMGRHRLKNQYMITHFVCDIVISTLNRMIFNDLMRICRKTVFYHHCHKLDNPAKEIIESFILLRPRRQPEGIEIIKRPDHGDLDVLQADSPLFCLTKFQLAKRKDIVAKRVIIAGGSSHSYAFLETLCGVSDVYYPNIYFIAPIPPLPLKENDLGLPENTIEEIKHDNGEDYYYYSGCLSLQDVDFPHANELWAMGYRHCIHVIRGHLTDIDRENRAVVISDELVLEYDYLLISTNTQDNSSRRIPSIATTHPAKLADAGIFALGNTAADLLALTFVKKRINNRSEPIVISGQGVKVLAAAEGLIRAGIESNKIVCLIEESHHHLEGCGEVSLSKLVAQSSQVAGISEIYFKAGIAEVELSRTGFLQSVELYEIQSTVTPGSRNHLDKERIPPPSSIQSTALLLCHGPEYQSCEQDVFAAINDCGLVFDGGLVVDLSFATVDPFIYAVSDYTKFSRVYRDDLPHHRFNPREVGVYVAWQMIIKHLHPQPDRLRNIKKSMTQLPTQDLRSNSSDTHSYTTPKTTSSSTTNSIKKQFMLPKSYYAALPGDLIYFYSSVPRLPRDLVGYLTDTASQPVQFFPHPPPPPRRITLLKTDAFGGVAELSYAGLDKVESRNLSLLVGKHEAYLNSAINAYNKKFVDDWISYFRGSWTTVLFQDTFSQLISALKKNMQSDKGMIMLLSRIFEKADLESDNVAVSEYRTNLMGAHGELAPEITRKIVEVETLEYLRENKDFLPKLYLPGAH